MKRFWTRALTCWLAWALSCSPSVSDDAFHSQSALLGVPVSYRYTGYWANIFGNPSTTIATDLNEMTYNNVVMLLVSSAHPEYIDHFVQSSAWSSNKKLYLVI